MTEKGIYENSDRQRDYIIFLEEIARICFIFKKKLDSGYKRIFFREKGVNDDWYGTQEEGWVNSLFCCVYDSVVSGTGALEISRSGHGAAEDTIDIQSNIRFAPGRMVEHGDRNLAEIKIKEVLERLENGFIDGEIINRLKQDSDTFFSTRNQLLIKQSVFHLGRKEVKRYLSQYYALLFDLVLFYNAFDQKQDRDIVIGELLHLDSVYDEKNAVYHIDFWSPAALNKLQKVSDGIAVFFRQIAENKNAENRWMQEIYKHILLIKAQHNFRWYIPGENWELMHAAIAPYVEDSSFGLKFEVIARGLEQCNSYEGIGELRLGEKIIYEYELAQKTVGDRFKVAIMGDLHAKPVEELYDYVYRKAGKQSGNFQLDFNIYTKNKWKVSENPHIIYQGCPEAALLGREKLDEVISTNNVVFILDCVELYKSPAPEKETYEFIKHKFAFRSYDEYNSGTEKPDICDRNMLEELYEILTCEQIFNQFGRISKRANGQLLEFCEEKQREAGPKSTIYVYVSDMKAFDNIYHDDQYYIRTERYNQKEIGIIRYSSEKVNALPVTSRDSKMLVFNVWQFIKNVAINERNMLLSGINESEDAYMDLDKINIGIDYKEWPHRLVVHYYCEENRYEQAAMKFINDILLPALNNRTQDMFNDYIRKAMHSFFFSAAKSVNDMLFIHLFQDKENLLGKVVPADRNDPEAVKKNINIKFKYSSKRFYDMIMQNYDMSSNIYVGQIRTSPIIQKNEGKGSRINKKEIYQNVIDACRNLSYKDGYLAKNCELEVNGRYGGGDI